jgi:putative membrane protein
MVHPGDHEVSAVGSLIGGPWSTEAIPWAMLAVSGSAYVVGLMRLRRASPRSGLRWWEPTCFAAGWLVILLAQVSPLAWLSEQLFAAHMTQHELLMLIAAPLLVLGRPLLVMLWALPRRGRQAVGGATRRRAFAAGWRWISAPFAVWALHGLALWIWHLPSWYQAAVAHEGLHLVQHACFLGTALLFWWTLVHGRFGRIGYGAAVLFIFTTMLHSGLLGALFTFSERAWYPTYARSAPAWHVSGLEDQQLAGLIMWIPFGVVFLVVALAMFSAWLGESDRRLRYGSVAALTAASSGERDAPS